MQIPFALYSILISMSKKPRCIEFPVSSASVMCSQLTDRIEEYLNASQYVFLSNHKGCRRISLALLIVALEEMGKLSLVMRASATAERNNQTDVRVEYFYDHGEKSKIAAGEGIDFLLNFKSSMGGIKGMKPFVDSPAIPKAVAELNYIKTNFIALREALLYYDVQTNVRVPTLDYETHDWIGSRMRFMVGLVRMSLDKGLNFQTIVKDLDFPAGAVVTNIP